MLFYDMLLDLYYIIY